MNIALRPAEPTDQAFVESIYFVTQRWLIEKLFGWRGEEYERKKFAEFYDEANSRIVSYDGADVGWLTLIQGEDSWELDSIYLAPDHQRRGLGTHLVSEIISQAAAVAVPLRLSTARINPARNLYTRLGFEIVGESEFKVYMELRKMPRAAQ